MHWVSWNMRSKGEKEYGRIDKKRNREELESLKKKLGINYLKAYRIF